MSQALVVDANPVLSALLGGAAREVVFSTRFVLHSPQHTLFEVEKYVPRMAEKLGRAELDLFREFELLPIVSHQPSEYDAKLDLASRLIAHRDPKDVHVLALSLHLKLPIWSHDRDFENIPGVTIRRTADLLAMNSD